MENQKTKIVTNTGVFSLNDYMNFLDESIAFEKSFEPLINDFGDYLKANGKNTTQITSYKNVCKEFIYFNSSQLGKKELIDITRAEACSKFNQFSNKGFINGYRKIDNRNIMKLFFTFLHLNKNITNIKVLKAFYSKEEIKKELKVVG